MMKANEVNSSKPRLTAAERRQIREKLKSQALRGDPASAVALEILESRRLRLPSLITLGVRPLA